MRARKHQPAPRIGDEARVEATWGGGRFVGAIDRDAFEQACTVGARGLATDDGLPDLGELPIDCASGNFVLDEIHDREMKRRARLEEEP